MIKLDKLYCILDKDVKDSIEEIKEKGIEKPNLFSDIAMAIYSDGKVGYNTVVEVSFKNLNKENIDKEFLSYLKDTSVFELDDISFKYNGNIPYTDVKRIFNVYDSGRVEDNG